jgi:hypothetical protein
MSQSRPTLVRQFARELTLPQARSVTELVHRSFPDPTVSLEVHVQHFLALRERRTLEMFTVWDRDVAIASATIFSREVGTLDGPLVLMALAAVCSDPCRRGEGWGRRVVEAAWGEVDRGRFRVALFQTPVPEFYEKLGARKVDSQFVNTGEPDPKPGRGTRDQPWWNPHIMIYPAAFAWPTGTIDLRGPGY